MSSAFVREAEDQWLHDIPPTINALIVYLTRENNGVRVYESSKHNDMRFGEVHVMSNGLSYAVDNDNKWAIID